MGSYSTDQAAKKLILDNISITADDLKDFVRDNFHPEQVFDVDVLEDWATENGFIKESENK